MPRYAKLKHIRKYPGEKNTARILDDGVLPDDFRSTQRVLHGMPYYYLDTRRRKYTLKEAILDLDPYFYLPFDNTAENNLEDDHSGNENNFTKVGTVTSYSRLVDDMNDDGSHTGSALFENVDTGATNYLELDNLGNFQVNNFSFICWYSAADNAGSGQGLIHILNSSSGNEFGIFWAGSGAGVININHNATNYASTLTKLQTIDKGPQMMVVTVDSDNDEIKIYIGGILRETISTTLTHINIDKYRIGTFSTSELNGYMDSVAIYHETILTAGQVRDLFLIGRQQFTGWHIPQFGYQRPWFFAILQNNQTATSSWQNLGIDEAIVDSHGILERGDPSKPDPMIGTINELTEGWWIFTLNVVCDAGNDEVLARINIDKNGSGFGSTWGFRGSRNKVEGSGDGGSILASHPIYLSSGDRFKPMFLNGGTRVLGYSTSKRTYMYGEWLGDTKPNQIGSPVDEYDT